MGDLNQLDFVLENRHRVKGPVLEIGSKDHGNAANFRAYFPDVRYVGADLEPGTGVDVVCDFTEPIEVLRHRLNGERFGTAICLSVMEHCHQPFKMAENITALLEPGATLFLSVPWVWNQHGFPDDYWRFTPSAVRVLFPTFDVVESASHWSTKNRGERLPFPTRKMNLHEAAFFTSSELADTLRAKGLTNFRHPYYCYPVMLNVLLVKRDGVDVSAVARRSSRTVLGSALDAQRTSPAYVNYLDARDHVLAWLDASAAQGGPARTSAYWAEELASIDYMLDASPLVVAKLREHCYHLTGLRPYDYRAHHAHKSRPFAQKLQSLRAVDRSGLFVQESPLLGGFGHQIDGGLVNLDTLKFYEAAIALDRAGVLPELRGASGRGKVVVEIGAGWGGFARYLKTLCPEIAIVLVDLPESLLFSGTYLKTAFPTLPLVYAGAERDGVQLHVPPRGFLLVPSFLFGRQDFPRPDVAVNMCSFQEMTTEQVRTYAHGLKMLGCPAVYSLNRDRSSHNSELTSVTEVLSEFFVVEEIPILNEPYTTLGPVAPGARIERDPSMAPYEYRHLIGRLRSAGGDSA